MLDLLHPCNFSKLFDYMLGASKIKITSPSKPYQLAQNNHDVPEIVEFGGFDISSLGCLIRLPCSLASGARNFFVTSPQVQITASPRRVYLRVGAICNWHREARSATQGALRSLAVKINPHDSACLASAQSGATLPEEVRVDLRGFDATNLPYKTGRC